MQITVARVTGYISYLWTHLSRGASTSMKLVRLHFLTRPLEFKESCLGYPPSCFVAWVKRNPWPHCLISDPRPPAASMTAVSCTQG